MRKNRIITLVFWGNLAREVKNYYQINDYILIEGYLSIRNKKNINLITKNSKQVVTITVTVGLVPRADARSTWVAASQPRGPQNGDT